MQILVIFLFTVLSLKCVLSDVFDTNHVIDPIQNESRKYEANWESVDSRPLPEWYDNAKVGIFVHWGVYCVPEVGGDWFWMNWRERKIDSYVDYMRKNFKLGTTYQELAHQLTAEHFNPVEWAELFERSGAKYVVLTSKHHDGYTLWPSKRSFSWNTVDVGPHRDVVGELAAAIRSRKSLKFGLYHSLYEWFNPLYMQDKNSSFTEKVFVEQKVLPELKDLVQTYKPEVIWSDGEWEADADYWNATQFLAWLYNDSPVSETVVTNDRWGGATLCNHGGFYTCADRFNPGQLQTHKWENAMTIDRYSWGYRPNARLNSYLTSQELINQLVTTVSCGGNILVNVGPSKTGLIDPIFVERLLDMGHWLNMNGEAIYGSTPWKYQNDAIVSGVWYTKSKQIENNRGIVYAIVLEYPYDTNNIVLGSMSSITDKNTNVKMIGSPFSLKWNTTDAGLFVTFPPKNLIDKNGLRFAWTLKIDVPVN